MKTCRDCRTQKPLTAFGKNAVSKDGLNYVCRACASARSRAYAAANPAKIAAKQAAWRAANAEHKRQDAARYYAENREERMAYSVAYHAAHTGARALYAAAYRRANPEVTKAQEARRRAREAGAAVGKLPRDIERHLFDQQFGWCACCGADLAETGYHVDHVTPLARGGAHAEDNLQLLTPKCNMAKGAKSPEEYADIVWARLNGRLVR